MTRGCKYLLFVIGLTITFIYLGSVSNHTTAQSSLTSPTIRGKQIYIQGTSPSGKDVLAYVGDSSIEVPASALTCAGCHGLDGQGKTEGGVTASNLTWEALTKPYGVTHADGRKHPPYTERALELAITRGTDPAGHKLQSVMPRYALSREDLADLIAYLKIVSKDRDPGITENEIVIGTAGPTKGPLGNMSRIINLVTTAYFDELNSQGGIYDRRIQVRFGATDDPPAATRANLERFLKEQNIFAMTSVMAAGVEKEIMPLMGQREVPLVGPLTLFPQTDSPLNRQVFYLLSGIDGQARSLVEFAASKPELKRARIAVVLRPSESNSGTLKAINEQCKKDGFATPQVYDYVKLEASTMVKQLSQAGAEIVFLLGGAEDALAFMTEADKSTWFPTIFLGNADDKLMAAPAGFNGKIFFSLPSSPTAPTAIGAKEFRAFADKYKLPPDHVATQVSAYSSAKILAEAMRRVGKDLSREKLIQALEGFYEYQTGLTPAITYGPNRRIGAMGGYVVTIDLKQKRIVGASDWINIY
jgi:ABC-type branched-subunit amino acid transport system substrate-binding protein